MFFSDELHTVTHTHTHNVNTYNFPGVYVTFIGHRFITTMLWNGNNTNGHTPKQPQTEWPHTRKATSKWIPAHFMSGMFLSWAYIMLGLHWTPEGRGTDDPKSLTRGYPGIGRQGRMFLQCYSPEGHKLLLNTRYNSGLIAIEIDKLHDRF